MGAVAGELVSPIGRDLTMASRLARDAARAASEQAAGPFRFLTRVSHTVFVPGKTRCAAPGPDDGVAGRGDDHLVAGPDAPEEDRGI
jgi:hypothetical protein